MPILNFNFTTMKKPIVLCLAFMVTSLMTFGQRTTEAQDADYTFLKDHKNFNLRFDYTGMTVGKNLTEEDYIAREMMEKNEKEPGSGERWREAWENAKINEYEPAFIAGFNKQLKKAGMTCTQGDDAEITLIVSINRLEPGFYSYALNKAAEMDITLTFVKTNNQEDIISQVIMTKVLGSEAPAVSQRVGAACTTAGVRLGRYVQKTFK